MSKNPYFWLQIYQFFTKFVTMTQQNALFLGWLCFFSLSAMAQSTFVPLHNWAYRTIDRIEIKSGQINDFVHTSVKPYLRVDVVSVAESPDEMVGIDFRSQDRFNQFYVYKDNNEWTDWGLVKSKKPFLKYFYPYHADLVHIKDYSDFLLKINPVLYTELGMEANQKSLRYENTRGIELRGMVSERLGFYALLTENQSGFPSYVQEKNRNEEAVLGEGRYKDFVSRVGDSLFVRGVDYFGARGYVTFQPMERVRVQFGHDKNFIGDGIRSLILSDNSNSYLFLKLQTQVWKLQYQNLFMELTHQYRHDKDSLLTKKYAAIHHLSINLTKWLNVGISETVVFSRSNGFELQYLNPIIFYRAIEYHLGSPDNVLLAADWKANFLKRYSLYGQFVLDEFSFGEISKGWWANKLALQTGLKMVNTFGVNNLDSQIEYNMAMPYTYTHNDAQANYTHYNQALAHPLGANFREILVSNNYRFKRYANIKWNLLYAQQGADIDSTNWGSNIFLDNTTHEQDYNNHLLQGDKTNTFLSDLTFSYMWKHNFWFDINYRYRHSRSEQSLILPMDTHYISGGVRWNIHRKEYLF